MKFFIAYRYTGEDKKELAKFMKTFCDLVQSNGHSSYCTFFEDEKKFHNKSKKEIINHAFDEIDKSDITLVIIRSEEKSEGMLIEVGYTLAKRKKLILCINEKVRNTYLRDLADEVIEYKDAKDLADKITEIKL